MFPASLELVVIVASLLDYAPCLVVCDEPESFKEVVRHLRAAVGRAVKRVLRRKGAYSLRVIEDHDILSTSDRQRATWLMCKVTGSLSAAILGGIGGTNNGVFSTVSGHAEQAGTSGLFGWIFLDPSRRCPGPPTREAIKT
jgi:hypothetical protein